MTVTAQVKSVLFDTENGKPIQFAHISNINTQSGSLSNEKGFFELSLNMNDSIHITHVQYRDTVIPANKLLNSKIDTILLSPTVLSLQSVDIHSEADHVFAKRLLDSVVANIENNYETQSTSSLGYVREIRKYNGKLSSLLEGRFNWYKDGYKQRKINWFHANFSGYRSNVYKDLKARVVVDSLVDQKIPDVLKNSVPVGFFNSRTFHLDIVEALPVNKSKFFKEKFVEFHDFHIAQEINQEDTIFKINIKPHYSSENHYPFHEKEEYPYNREISFWINKSNYAIVRYKDRSAEKSKKSSQSVLKSGFPLEFVDVYTTNQEVENHFKTENDKLILDKYMYRRDLSVLADSNAPSYSQTVLFYRDKILEYDVDAFSDREIESDRTIQDIYDHYREDFWEEPFPLKLEKEYKSALTSPDDKLSFQPVNNGKQDTQMNIDTGDSIQDKKEAKPPEKAKRSDMLMLAWGNDIWLDTPDDIDVRGYNPSFLFSGMYDIPLGYSRFSLAAGLGFQSNNLYNTDGYVSANDHSGKMTFKHFPDSVNLSKNKLNATYLEFPFELRLRMGEHQNSTLALGFKVGYLIHSKSKYKGDNFRWSEFPEKEEVKIKEYNIPGLNKLKYAATIRLTSNETKYGIFAEYNLSSLFEKDKLMDSSGNEVNMSLITAGLIISVF